MSTSPVSSSRILVIGLAIVVFCLIMAAVGRGMGDTYAVFLLPLSEGMEWERAKVASIYAVFVTAMLGVAVNPASLTSVTFSVTFTAVDQLPAASPA